MARYLKRGVDATAIKAADAKVRETVEQILADIEKHKDTAVRELSRKFDNWSPPSFKLTADEIEKAIAQVRKRDLEDIKFAQVQARNFAQKQKDTLRELEVETLPGVVLGHKHIPVDLIGCYVPGGRYPMVASAHMSIVTARVAGVKHIIACAPPFKGGPHPAIVAAMHFGGADEIFVLGGVQAVAAMGLGTETIPPRRYDRWTGQCLCRRSQAAAFRPRRHRSARGTHRDTDHRRRDRRQRNLRDRFARPSRAWPTSPAVLITDLEKLARETLKEVERLLTILPTADTAGKAWADFGEVIVCEDAAEMLREADRVASEHVQVMTRDPDYFLDNMKNYGSLFLGPRTNVAYGDKVIGTDHRCRPRKRHAIPAGCGSANS